MAASSPKFTALAQPFKLGDLTLKNRIVMSALTRNRSVPTNVPNEANQLYYEQRASAGLIISEGALIYQTGTEWPYAPGIWNDQQVAAWKDVIDRVHMKGGKIFCQLWGIGRVAHPDMPEQKEANEPVWAPSAISARGGNFRLLDGAPGYVTPTAIPDPSVLVQRFVKAAENAKKAGFDGVEIHAANGYLINQFIDNTCNQRTDQWGGSAENRLRFVFEIMDQVIKVFPPNRVAIKLSPNGGYNDTGMPVEDVKETFAALINQCIRLKLGFVDLARYQEAFDIEFDGKKRATQLDVVSTFGPLFKGTDTKLFVNGGIEPEEAEKLVQDGVADGAIIGRPMINNSDYYDRIQAGVPLSTEMTYMTWFASNGKPDPKYGNHPNPDDGYTDFPFSDQL